MVLIIMVIYPFLPDNPMLFKILLIFEQKYFLNRKYFWLMTKNTNTYYTYKVFTSGIVQNSDVFKRSI